MDVGGLRQRKPEPIDKLVTEAGMDVSGAGTKRAIRRCFSNESYPREIQRNR